MRFEFRQLPSIGDAPLPPRPVVDVWLEGIDRSPLACLVDTGALRTRFSAELADVAGIELPAGPTERFTVGGATIEGVATHVELRVGSGEEAESWQAPVWFCDPWPFAFQLLGLDGFLRYFRVTISGYREWVELRRER